MLPQNIRIEDYTYHLPDEKIAKFSLNKRDESKLLVYKNEDIINDHFYNINQHIPAGSLLILNNTKVLPARLFFTNSTGGAIEIFCLEPAIDNTAIKQALQKTNTVNWRCFVGGAKKWKPNETLTQTLTVNNTALQLNASLVHKEAESFVITFSWSNNTVSFFDIMQHAGALPIPPYLKREATEQDAQTYQTTYSKHFGSVAAPTAGLHFTPKQFEQLQNNHVKTAYVTLHVGAGTFKPVKSEYMQQHYMHTEEFVIDINLIETILQHNPNHAIIAVGTTTVRTLESLYWMGVKLLTQQQNCFTITQWEVYQLPNTFTVTQALTAVQSYLQNNQLQQLIAYTQILIAPSYTFKIPKAIITNFHQPCSTLILLVAAWIGKDWEKIYNHALQNDYRFLSYGDSSLLWGKG